MELTAIQRAENAAEELAMSGEAVTARAVRAASGVRMVVAADVARKYNERVASEVAVPEMPPAVAARVSAMWREAYTLAQRAFVAEQEHMNVMNDQARAEIDQLNVDLDEVETQRDEAREAAAEAGKRVDELRSRLDRIEGQAEDRKAEAERLRDELRELRAQLDQERTRADRAEARAEALIELRSPETKEDDSASRR